MMKNFVQLIFVLIIIVSLVSCSSFDTKKGIVENSQIIDSVVISTIDSIDIVQLTKYKWYKVIASDCITYLILKQDYHYEEDNCEWGLVFDGQFKILNDTLSLTEYGYASEVPSDNNRIVPKFILMYIYMTDSLKFISNQKIEDGKVVSIYYPSNPIYYYREK